MNATCFLLIGTRFNAKWSEAGAAVIGKHEILIRRLVFGRNADNALNKQVIWR